MYSITLSAQAREIYGFSAEAAVTQQAARSRVLDEDLEAVEKCWRAALDPAGQGRFEAVEFFAMTAADYFESGY